MDWQRRNLHFTNLSQARLAEVLKKVSKKGWRVFGAVSHEDKFILRIKRQNKTVKRSMS